MRDIIVAPSIICADPCNFSSELKTLESAGAKLLHVDFIDGYFSPSVPIGIDTIKALNRCTSIPMSLHMMAKDNERFISMIEDIHFEHITFHLETTLHADRLLNKLHELGCKAGLALTPQTPVSCLEYLIEKCDVITLMLINPGYAGSKQECQISYALKKISNVRNFIEKSGTDTKIEIDGRIKNEQIPGFVKAGADIIVSGSSGIFSKSMPYDKFFSEIKSIINI
ncbi:MAG: ribulose-phosphate 3-epimerase [Prevotella sp.]|jgi:ribulose-phosphate 3-epimerase|nr:ribulose-phosphate 3-epimerase [Prevotella sp.]